MKCKACGKEIPRNSNVCCYCGEKIRKKEKNIGIICFRLIVLIAGVGCIIGIINLRGYFGSGSKSSVIVEDEITEERLNEKNVGEMEDKGYEEVISYEDVQSSPIEVLSKYVVAFSKKDVETMLTFIPEKEKDVTKNEAKFIEIYERIKPRTNSENVCVEYNNLLEYTGKDLCNSIDAPNLNKYKSYFEGFSKIYIFENVTYYDFNDAENKYLMEPNSNIAVGSIDNKYYIIGELIWCE